MSDNDNFYQSPQTDVNAVNPLAPEWRLTKTMVLYLKGASPWLRFLGILAFIGAGGTMLGGVLFLISGAWGGFLIDMLTSLDTADTVEVGVISGITIFTGVLIIITGMICFFPARFIYNFGNKIKKFLQNNSEEELESAFKNNKSFWKFVGILSIIYLAFLPVMLITSIIAVIGAYML